MSEDMAVAVDRDSVVPDAVPSESLASIAHVALPAGVAQADFDAVLTIGRAKGQLTQAEMIEALHAVELTPEVLTELIDRVTAEGVALVPDEDEDLAVEVAPRKDARAQRKQNGTHGEARREAAPRRTSATSESSGSAEDPVHTYLKEIGRVPLLERGARGRDRQDDRGGERGCGGPGRARDGPDR